MTIEQREQCQKRHASKYSRAGQRVIMYSHPLVICDTDSLLALAVLLVILRIDRRRTTMLHHASKLLKSEIF